ncbi:MAG: sigma-70 family RNA polymerase sigma factor [bacterium]|nr:sigma-70 family RNA polymerase sigma factor [bacterium]
MSSSQPIDPQEVLRQAPWLRRLARRLVGDSNQADDLIQDACVVLLDRPSGIADPVGWFAGTLRNLARRSRRSDTRRRDREQRSARGEAGISTDALVDRADWQNALVHRVHELREPYRTTLLLHFMEEMSPRAIARQLQVSVNTVRTRISRGLQILREQLDQTGAGRDSWMPCFVAWSCKPELVLTPSHSLLLMKVTTKVVAVSLACIVGFGVWQSIAAPSPEPENESLGMVVSDLQETDETLDIQTPLEFVPLQQPPTASPRSTLALGPQVDAKAGELSTRVEVIVSSRSTGIPLPEIFLRLTPKDPSTALSNELLDAVQRTDENGEAFFEVPSDLDLQLFAAGERGQVEQKWVAVGLLAAGEHREVHIALGAGLDRTWMGRIVESGSQIGLGSARVELRDRSTWEGPGSPKRLPLEFVTSRSDGHFDIAVPSWQPTVAWVHLKGYASRLAGIALRNDRMGKEQVIELERAARLEVSVDMAAPRSGEELTIQVFARPVECLRGQELSLLSGWEDAVWEQDWLGQGAIIFENLPVGVPLRLELHRGERLLTTLEEPLKLTAGETHAVSLKVQVLGSIAGRVLEAGGEPAAGQKLWLWKASVPQSRLFVHFDRDKVESNVESQGDGSFEFSGVPAGDWCVGPDPGRFSYGAPGGVSKKAVAPLGSFVRVKKGSTSTLDITLQRGLAIGGRVEDAAGKPMPHAWVQARSVLFDGVLVARSGMDGSFVVGPLPMAAYQLGAALDGVSTPWVSATVGDDQVHLVFPVAGGISGRLLGLSDKDVGRFLLFTPAGSGAPGKPFLPRPHLRYLQYTTESAFSLASLAPGSYDVVVWASGEWVGVRHDITVQAGQMTTDIDLSLSLAARVSVQFTGPDPYARFEASQGDSLVAAVYVGNGKNEVLVLPPGATTIRLWSMSGQSVSTREVNPVAGEELDLVLSLPE